MAQARARRPTSRHPGFVRPGHPYVAGPPVLCAHRGGAGLAPENTFAAFRQALDLWRADMLEMDVHATRDGRIVVIHDGTVDRTTDGTGAVADMSWTELRELDAGFRFQDLEGGFPFRGAGERIPLFEEILEAFPHARINVEIKDRRAATGMVEVVRRLGAEHRVLVAVEWEWRRWAVRGYRGPWGASREQLYVFWMLHDTPLSFLARPRADILQIPLRWKGTWIATDRFVEEAHRRNLPVHVWTVDDEEDMRALLKVGVDGIQTDRPDVLARVLHDVARRPVPPGLSEARAG